MVTKNKDESIRSHDSLNLSMYDKVNVPGNCPLATTVDDIGLYILYRFSPVAYGLRDFS